VEELASNPSPLPGTAAISSKLIFYNSFLHDDDNDDDII
jgi:hypothetical protein